MSFYVRKSGKTGWIIYQQTFKEGKRAQTALPAEAYAALGIDLSCMSVDQAKQHVKKLNIERNLERK